MGSSPPFQIGDGGPPSTRQTRAARVKIKMEGCERIESFNNNRIPIDDDDDAENKMKSNYHIGVYD